MVNFLTRHHVFRFCNVVPNDSTRLSDPAQNNSRADFATVSLSLSTPPPPPKKQPKTRIVVIRSFIEKFQMLLLLKILADFFNC